MSGSRKSMRLWIALGAERPLEAHVPGTHVCQCWIHRLDETS